MKHECRFATAALVIVKTRNEYAGRLLIGDRVILNSGGPVSLVVDTDGEIATVAWAEGSRVAELRAPQIIFRRLNEFYP